MKAKLIIGGQVRKINLREVNGYVRTVREAFRMESFVTDQVRVEVLATETNNSNSPNGNGPHDGGDGQTN